MKTKTTDTAREKKYTIASFDDGKATLAPDSEGDEDEKAEVPFAVLGESYVIDKEVPQELLDILLTDILEPWHLLKLNHYYRLYLFLNSDLTIYLYSPGACADPWRWCAIRHQRGLGDIACQGRAGSSLRAL